MTEALKFRNWQSQPNPLRTKDARYNRACYQSKLGQTRESQQKEWKTLLDRAVEDLEKACDRYESEERVRKQTLETLLADCEPGGDLAWLSAKRPEAIEAAKQELQ